MTVAEQIAERLRGLDLQVLECEDQSHLHIGHAGSKSGGGHYALLLVGSVFEGMPRIQRQRMVFRLLDDLFAAGRIHALAVQARTPAEYFTP